jgi:hypothetical protein
MSDGVLGTIGVGAMLAFIAGASLYLRLTKDRPDVVDEDALRRIRRRVDANRRNDPELWDDPPGR